MISASGSPPWSDIGMKPFRSANYSMTPRCGSNDTYSSKSIGHSRSRRGSELVRSPFPGACAPIRRRSTFSNPPISAFLNCFASVVDETGHRVQSKAFVWSAFSHSSRIEIAPAPAAVTADDVPQPGVIAAVAAAGRHAPVGALAGQVEDRAAVTITLVNLLFGLAISCTPSGVMA